MKKILTTLLTLILGTNLIFAQSVGINSDGSAPASSAMLDVSSTAKGFLAPRMTAVQKAAITSPATGLLVYQTDAPAGYYYNSGTPASPAWIQLGAASGSSQWTTTGSNIYYNTGNVGIGTTSPQAKLQVDGRVIINYAAAPGFYGQSAGANKVYLGYDGAGTGLELYNFTSGRSLMVRDNGDLTYLGNVGIGTNTPTDLLQVGNLMFGGNSGREIYSTSGYDINYKATGASSHHFYANGTEIFTIDKTGNIGIGVNSPSQPLHMSSGAHVTTAGVWTNASDARLKTNVVNTNYGLQTVMQLRPVNYNMVKGGEAQVGFLAQEVQKIVPEVVSGTEGDITKGETLGLSYGNLVPVLTKAIQDQQALIEKLQAENAAMKAEIETIKKVVYGSTVVQK